MDKMLVSHQHIQVSSTINIDNSTMSIRYIFIQFQDLGALISKGIPLIKIRRFFITGITMPGKTVFILK